MNRRTDAAGRGERTFDSVKPCKHDGSLERYTCNGACVICQKKRASADYQRFRTLLKAAARQV